MFFILFYIFDTAMKKWKSKNDLRLFFVLSLTLLLKSRVSHAPTRNSTLLLLEDNTIFLQECIIFLGGHKLFQFNFPETYLVNLCVAARLKLLEDGFSFIILIFVRPSLVSDIKKQRPLSLSLNIPIESLAGYLINA